MGLLAAADLAGQRLLSVTASFHEFGGVASKDPTHAWLRLDRSGYVRCHTAGSGDLELTTTPPYAPCDLEEHGRILVVSDRPEVLAAHTGEVIEAVRVLDQDPPGMPVGVVLTFPSGPVALANLWDELVIDVWPGAARRPGRPHQ